MNIFENKDKIQVIRDFGNFGAFWASVVIMALYTDFMQGGNIDVCKKIEILDFYSTDGGSVDQLRFRYNVEHYKYEWTNHKNAIQVCKKGLGFSIFNGNQWTQIFLETDQWLDGLSQAYWFKVSVKHNDWQINQMCQTSSMTDIKDHCDDWVDPQEPSYVLKIKVSPKVWTYQNLAQSTHGASHQGSNLLKKYKNPNLYNEGGYKIEKYTATDLLYWQIDLPRKEAELWEINTLLLQKFRVPENKLYNNNKKKINRTIQAVSNKNVIEQVQMQYSRDFGATWIYYDNGRYLKTGQKQDDGEGKIREIQIDPPIYANKFRVVFDSQTPNKIYAGRFDLVVFPRGDLNPTVPQYAIMDYGAQYSTEYNPKLDSPSGIPGNIPWEVNFPLTENLDFEIQGLVLKKSLQPHDQTIDSVTMEVFQDEEWVKHGEYPTGIVDTSTETRIEIQPIVAKKIRVVLNDPNDQLWRFDLQVLKK